MWKTQEGTLGLVLHSVYNYKSDKAMESLWGVAVLRVVWINFGQKEQDI